MKVSNLLIVLACAVGAVSVTGSMLPAGSVIRQLREKQNLTQLQLAQKLAVSDKTVSKWETGRGLPDISLLEPLAKELRVSVPELLSGEQIENRNRSANLRRSSLYVCPLCGNRPFHRQRPGLLLRHLPAAPGAGDAG